jgi:acyl carrier protein
MTEDLETTLAQQIAAKIIKKPGRAISADEPLLTTGLIDSFSLVDLALLVEDQYGVRIDDSELNPDTFDTVAQLAALIRERK